MARPVNANAEQTKRRILGTASALFSTQGAGETSMRQIAKGAEVSLATVHHYFGSKAELVQTATEAMYEELALLRDELAPIIEQADDLGRALREAIHRTYAFVCEHRDEVRLLMRTVIGSGTSPADKREAFLLPLLEQGAAVLSQLTGVSAARARMTLLSLNHLVVRYALTDPDELAEVTGVEAPGRRAARAEAAHQRVEDHLVDLAGRLLDLPFSSEPTSAQEPA